MNEENGLFMNLLNGVTGIVLAGFSIFFLLVVVGLVASSPMLILFAIISGLLGWIVFKEMGLIDDKVIKVNQSTGEEYVVKKARKIDQKKAIRLFAGFLFLFSISLIVMVVVVYS